MHLNNTILGAVFYLAVIVAQNIQAAGTQGYTANDLDESVNLGLYPPLSTGEASPWLDSSEINTPNSVEKGNSWGANSLVPTQPKPFVVPMVPAIPYYGYQRQPQLPYYYPPQQGYGYVPPNSSYTPNYGNYNSYPQMPYGQYGPIGGMPFNSMPFGNMPFDIMPFGASPFGNYGNTPFGFSMPWPF